MSYCAARHENGYPCSNRQKCRNGNNRCRNYEVQEEPVRDTVYIKPKPEMPPEDAAGQFPPPEPPNGQYGDWELQFCKWWGWTWVRKSGKEIPAHEPPPPRPPGDPARGTQQNQDQKKKKGGFFSCFKKRNEKPEPPKPPPPRQPSAHAMPPPRRSEHDGEKSRPRRSEEQITESCRCDDVCCCGMEVDYCCPCNQVCCPCNQICCCCTDEEPRQRRDSKTIETQTQKEVKEKATKMSEMCVPKQRPCCGRRRRCRCRRPVCCPCMRNTCCPCVQNVCCRCNGKSQSRDSSSRRVSTNQLINYCLTSGLNRSNKTDLYNKSDVYNKTDLYNKPERYNKTDVYNFKSTNLSTNFNTLHKSLGLLLKNNINILNLFNDKKEMRHQAKPTRGFASNHTITCLSSDNLTKKPDQEHTNLLTAVCDAILSSHKFDNDKLNPLTTPLRVTSSKSMHKTYCESKSSKDSLNQFMSRGVLEKILNDLNFTYLSNDDLGVQREIGVQVGPKKIEPCSRPKRSFTKLMKNRSRILTAPRFPKKIEALKRNLEALRAARDGKAHKRNLSVNFADSGSKTEKRLKVCDRLSLTDIFKIDEAKWNGFDGGKNCQMGSSGASRKDRSKSDNMETLLGTVDFTAGPSSSFKATEGRHHDLLDATTLPPFADLDFLLSSVESKSENKEKEEKRDSSR